MSVICYYTVHRVEKIMFNFARERGDVGWDSLYSRTALCSSLPLYLQLQKYGHAIDYWLRVYFEQPELG
jgi:hypothetical protein